MLYVSTFPDYLDSTFLAGSILIAPDKIVSQGPLSTNSSGEALTSVPLNKPSLIGRSFFAQAHTLSPSLYEQVSNGLEVIICP
tara:strand:- start:465 stop:713 length:249 start_codon:yes stop_codon:yes gene_type:complete